MPFAVPPDWWGWPIILDKGILGLGAAFCAYLLGRALERYRLASIYAQKLAERRIEAYDKLSERLFAEGQSLADLMHRIEATFVPPGLPADDLKKLMDDLRDFTASPSAPPPELCRDMSYFSDAASDASTVQILALAEFKLFLRTAKLGANPVKLFRDRSLGLSAAYTEVHKALANDLARPPEPRRTPMSFSGPSAERGRGSRTRDDDYLQSLTRRVRSFAHWRWQLGPDGLFEPQKPRWGDSEYPPAETSPRPETTGSGGPSRDSEKGPASHGEIAKESEDVASGTQTRAHAAGIAEAAREATNARAE